MSFAVPACTAAVTADLKIRNQVEHVVLKQHKVSPKPKQRKDYQPSDFRILRVDLKFDLYDNDTKVESRLVLCRTSKSKSNLCLDGFGLRLSRIAVDGNALSYSSSSTSCSQPVQEGGNPYVYWLSSADDKLCILGSILPSEPDVDFTVETEVLINPIENLQLVGLYKTGKLFCTQCEAEGFRRITYFLDRPDIMSKYKVTIAADKQSCPVLLSNGNAIESGKCKDDSNRHYVVFDDPFPKPCYLFALIAGQLQSITDSFTTMSGRKVRLEIFSEPEDVGKLKWAMESIKKAMKWDEEAFGREYDLDAFNIVCAKDFNMGAMENKGLNVFNTGLLLADEKTTTDAEFQRILNIIGHEYFHNWTGNRVTCRDWFQLTLKEGLTVFREQQFARSVASEAVKRIEDVTYLRTRQFAEDNGPMSHPIRPESYIAMDNFYTGTVYDKGAEVIRMYHTLLGESGFRKGMDLYFERHDGQAVTCDDFRSAMAEANNVDLTQFENWYLQNGTPLLEVLKSVYDDKKNTYSLTLRQSIPSVPNSPYLPLHIPVRMGLLGTKSKKDLLPEKSKVLELREMEQTFEIDNVMEKPVPSILRDFSAPVRVRHCDQTDEALSFLMAYDTDHFNRWDAGQLLATKILLSRTEQLRGICTVNRKNMLNELSPLPKIFLDAVEQCLKIDDDADLSLQAFTLCLPDEDYLHLEMAIPVDYDAVHEACLSVRSELCRHFKQELLSSYKLLTERLEEKPQSDRVGYLRCLDQKTVGRRRLRNVVLYYLCGDDDAKNAGEIAYRHFEKADCMTDKLAGFKYTYNTESKYASEATKKFYEDAAGDPLMIDKWFTIQALGDNADCIDRVEKLQSHPDFNMKNPNRLRSLIFAFSRNNTKFHCITGRGYDLVRRIIVEVDKFNPQAAARACSCLTNWKLVDVNRQELIKKELQCILDTVGLSIDTCEIASKALRSQVE